MSNESIPDGAKPSPQPAGGARSADDDPVPGDPFVHDDPRYPQMSGPHGD
ncbi:hypothetical protein R20943_03105 [Paraburkholderia aspalathi]|jgi:hypothetical protein|nr:hypothetical protein R20943_03105 [Paraburkholderia aspalathi]